MGTLLLLQTGLDLALIAIVTVLLIDRVQSKNKDNPRLSRGLQLLANKLAILQDLIDRSEATGKQLSQLIEGKQQDVYDVMEEVDRHLHKVQESMEKSKSIARLFQDRIPHEEVIERQTAAKYIKAAKLANQGVGVESIAAQVDIPIGELELIVKLNRQGLIPRDQTVWLGDDDVVQTPISEAGLAESNAEEENVLSSSGNSTPLPGDTNAISPTPRNAPTAAASFGTVSSAPPSAAVTSTPAEPVIRPVVFKRIRTDFN